MRLVLFRWLLIVVALAAVVGPLSVSWVRPLDAPPEAVVTGGSLLILASVLRHSRIQSRVK